MQAQNVHKCHADNSVEIKLRNENGNLSRQLSYQVTAGSGIIMPVEKLLSTCKPNFAIFSPDCLRTYAYLGQKFDEFENDNARG